MPGRRRFFPAHAIHRLMSKWSWFVLGLAAAALPAQDPPPRGGADHTRTQAPPLTAGSYSEAKSRDLFAVSDADGDDRLDVFEAADALDSIAGPKDSEAFRRLDRDRDGFVSWPEFDEHFWRVTERGGTFQVRPSRQVGEQAPERREARAATPMQRFLRLHDENGNGGLDPDEIENVVRRTGVSPGLGSKLRTLDHDGSGLVDETELAPWFELLRGIVPEASESAVPARGELAPPWRAGDVDGNGRIDEAEFASILRHLDASLLRWANDLMQALDRDGNGCLTAEELPPAPRPRRHPVSQTPRAVPGGPPGGPARSPAPAPTPGTTLSQVEGN
jgi:Ca2+-binding EF-hand superfamily protein